VFGYKETIPDMWNQPVKEGNVKYIPSKKRPKLRHTAPDPQHCSMKVYTTVCTTHSQVLPHEHFQECCCDMQGTHFIQQQEYLIGGISQVCTKPNVCKKCSPKCLPGSVPFCSPASGESRLPMRTSSFLDEKIIASNENTTIQEVCKYIRVCPSCDINDACKMKSEVKSMLIIFL
jgi:hypothetical protein